MLGIASVAAAIAGVVLVAYMSWDYLRVMELADSDQIEIGYWGAWAVFALFTGPALLLTSFVLALVRVSRGLAAKEGVELSHGSATRTVNQ